MADLLTAIRWFFSSAWDFFTEITVPGIGVSFAALFVALFFASLGLRLFLGPFGFAGKITVEDVVTFALVSCDIFTV